FLPAVDFKRLSILIAFEPPDFIITPYRASPFYPLGIITQGMLLRVCSIRKLCRGHRGSVEFEPSSLFVGELHLPSHFSEVRRKFTDTAILRVKCVNAKSRRLPLDAPLPITITEILWLLGNRRKEFWAKEEFVLTVSNTGDSDGRKDFGVCNF